MLGVIFRWWIRQELVGQTWGRFEVFNQLLGPNLGHHATMNVDHFPWKTHGLFQKKTLRLASEQLCGGHGPLQEHPVVLIFPRQSG